ncbi:MAG: ABC transporter ATP-binding protein [Deltaproteobacteria bacterium]|nr:ABC transporter ATP-binding protein [Deltaproteobacteria bacterium]
MRKIIETENLRTNFYTYEGVVKALNDVCITVNHGETFGLVGESGCGKSVTVRSMMRIIQPPGKVESGKVLLFLDENGEQEAVDLLQQSESYMQSCCGDQISMIFQEPNAALNPILSIGEQVAESFLFHRKKSLSEASLERLNAQDCKVPFKGIFKNLYKKYHEDENAFVFKLLSHIPLLNRWDFLIRQEAFKRAVEIISKLGIPHAEDIAVQFPHNLSGGMKQRIVIAIALACSPMLLIADEATSNLDVTIQAQILELLKDLKKKHISSILLITHDLGVVAETCDRVGVMYAGSLCEVAESRELFGNPSHPYTKALLESVPKFHQEGALKTIEGNVPNLVTPPAGCRFHPRCKHRMDICDKEVPNLLEIGKNHSVACHLFGDK